MVAASVVSIRSTPAACAIASSDICPCAASTCASGVTVVAAICAACISCGVCAVVTSPVVTVSGATCAAWVADTVVGAAIVVVVVGISVSTFSASGITAASGTTPCADCVIVSAVS